MSAAVLCLKVVMLKYICWSNPAATIWEIRSWQDFILFFLHYSSIDNMFIQSMAKSPFSAYLIF